MVFTCEKCGRDFTRADVLKNHINKKNPCVIALPEIIPKTTCDACGTNFTVLSNLYRHRKFCVVLKNKGKIQKIKDTKDTKKAVHQLINYTDEQLNKKTEQIIEMREQIEQMREQIEKLITLGKTHIGDNNTTNNNININQYINQNGDVILNTINTTHSNHISTKEVITMLDEHTVMAPVEMAHRLFHSDDAPENHVVHVLNDKNGVCGVYRSHTGWNSCDVVEMDLIYRTLIDVSYETLLKEARLTDKYTRSHTIIQNININYGTKNKMHTEVTRFIKHALVFKHKKGITPETIDRSIQQGKLALANIKK